MAVAVPGTSQCTLSKAAGGFAWGPVNDRFGGMKRRDTDVVGAPACMDGRLTPCRRRASTPPPSALRLRHPPPPQGGPGKQSATVSSFSSGRGAAVTASSSHPNPSSGHHRIPEERSPRPNLFSHLHLGSSLAGWSPTTVEDCPAARPEHALDRTLAALWLAHLRQPRADPRLTQPGRRVSR